MANYEDLSTVVQSITVTGKEPSQERILAKFSADMLDDYSTSNGTVQILENCGGIFIGGVDRNGRCFASESENATADVAKTSNQFRTRLAGVLLGAIMTGMTRFVGTESYQIRFDSGIYLESTKRRWRFSIAEAKVRARRIQIEADQRRQKFIEQETEQEAAIARMYDL